MRSMRIWKSLSRKTSNRKRRRRAQANFYLIFSRKLSESPCWRRACHEGLGTCMRTRPWQYDAKQDEFASFQPNFADTSKIALSYAGFGNNGGQPAIRRLGETPPAAPPQQECAQSQKVTAVRSGGDWEKARVEQGRFSRQGNAYIVHLHDDVKRYESMLMYDRRRKKPQRAEKLSIFYCTCAGSHAHSFFLFVRLSSCVPHHVASLTPLPPGLAEGAAWTAPFSSVGVRETMRDAIKHAPGVIR